MMTTIPHTATPWKVHIEPRSSWVGSTDTTYIIPQSSSDPTLDAIATFWVQDGLGEHKANAAFVIKAVNSHDALVNALQDAIDKLSRTMKDLDYSKETITAVLTPYRTALTQAGVK